MYNEESARKNKANSKQVSMKSEISIQTMSKVKLLTALKLANSSDISKRDSSKRILGHPVHGLFADQRTSTTQLSRCPTVTRASTSFHIFTVNLFHRATAQWAALRLVDFGHYSH